MNLATKFYPYALAVKGYVKSLFTNYEDNGSTAGDVDFVVTGVDGNNTDWLSEILCPIFPKNLLLKSNEVAHA